VHTLVKYDGTEEKYYGKRSEEAMLAADAFRCTAELQVRRLPLYVQDTY
tara:strand:+ start:562 stop:708 length:147 start_codon:yes stop_codon:yes gene_type:complete